MKEFELVESAAWTDFYCSASPEIIARCGIKIFPVGGVNGTIASKIDILAFNRIVGLGVKQSIDEQIIDVILNKIEANRVKRFFIQIHPEFFDDKLRKLLTLHDFYHYNNWVRLVRDNSPPANEKTNLSIKKISRSESNMFAEIVVKAFDWSPELSGWIAAPVERKNWHHYMAFEKNIPVATAAFYLSGEYAWFDFAATLPDFRGKSAQSILLARRIEDCRSIGVKTIIVETAEQTSEKEAPSYRNILKAGFKEVYKRPNYIFVKK
jgi:hypothetical protein